MQYVALLTQRWRAFSPALRAVIAVAGAAALLASILAGIFAHAPRGALYATPLHAEQLAEVEERLAAWNVAFTPTADNVVVEIAHRNDLLLRLGLAGVPHEHLETTGEALANVGALTPQAVIDAQARAGLAGDIEAGLRGIEGVDDARVIVAPAKPAEFADETARGASASVRLRMRAGVHLGRVAVAGVRAFVAAAVPGLSTANVTILDDSGAALGDAENAGETADLQNSLQAALDAAYGAGATIVRIRTEYRDGGVTQHDVRRSALGPQSIERSARNETYVDGAKHYHHDDQAEDRGSETNEVFSDTPPGSIRKISTAVFVDRSRVADVAPVRDLAAAAVGYDPRRGDTLAVAAIDFRQGPIARKDWWWLLYGALVPLGPALVSAVAIVIVARLAFPSVAEVLRPLIERASLRQASRSVAGLEPARVRNVLSHEPPHAAAAVISALPAATAAAVLDLYPAHEREAIVRRMQRPHTPLLRDAEELLRRHA